MTPDHRTGRGHYNILASRGRAPALVLDERFAALVGHGALHGVELHRLVGGRGGIIQIVTDRAEGPGHHDAARFDLASRPQDVAGADHVALEYLPAMVPIAFDRRYLGRDMVDASAALDRAPRGVEIPDVAERAFDIQTFQACVVVLVSEQHTHADAVGEQPADEVGAHMPGGSGNENGRDRWSRG